MANHASAAKRARQRTKRSLRNRLVLGTLRSSLKRARGALGQSDPQAAESLVQSAAHTAARAASKGVIHRNAAARLNSRLQRALNKIRASA